MSSVMSSFRQKPSSGKYFIVTDATPDASGAFVMTSPTKPSTVFYNNSGSSGTVASELPQQDSTTGLSPTIVPQTPGSVGAIYRDLGSEIHVYSGTGLSGQSALITSPSLKLSTWRAAALVNGADAAKAEGAPGQTAPVVWLKVWSASGLGLGVNRI